MYCLLEVGRVYSSLLMTSIALFPWEHLWLCYFFSSETESQALDQPTTTEHSQLYHSIQCKTKALAWMKCKGIWWFSNFQISLTPRQDPLQSSKNMASTHPRQDILSVRQVRVPVYRSKGKRKHLGRNSSVCLLNFFLNKQYNTLVLSVLSNLPSRVKGWTRKREDSLALWTSAFQSFFLPESCRSKLNAYPQNNKCPCILLSKHILF